MAISWTSRGLSRFTNWLDGGSAPGQLRLRLTRDVPTWATKLMSELDEIPNGNGYSPLNVNPGSANWSGETENDAVGERYLERRLTQVDWNATGGDIPSSGAGFEAVVLTDTASNPNVIAYIDLGRARTVLSGTSLTIPSLALRFAEGSLPAGLGGGSVASSPQSAYLSQSSPGANTYYDLLDYSSGGGFMHHIRMFIGGSGHPDARITVDGVASTFEWDVGSVDADMGQTTATADRVRSIPLHIRFEASLKIEVRRTNTSMLIAKCYYSTDI